MANHLNSDVACIFHEIFPTCGKLLFTKWWIMLLKKPVKLFLLTQVTQIDIPVHPPNPIGLPVYDKDKLAWEIEPDLNGETLRIRLVHKDVKNIPRNHIRCSLEFYVTFSFTFLFIKSTFWWCMRMRVL